MNTVQALKMALKSIWNNKARTILTMLGVIIGIAAVIILVSLVQGYQRSQMEYYQKQGVNKINVMANVWNGKDISQELYDYCQSLDDLVLGVTPVSEAWNQTVRYKATKAKDTRVLLGSDQLSICYNYKLAAGRDFAYLDIQRRNKVCVIGGALKDALFQYMDPVGQKLRIGADEFTVIGVYERVYDADDQQGNYYDNVVVVPYTHNRMLLKTNRMDQFMVRATDATTSKEAASRLSSFLKRKITPSSGYYDVYPENSWMESSDEQAQMMAMVLGGIAGIALLVGGIGIMNIMLVTVTERTKEIGIRKAIGAKRGAIVTQFLIESAAISLLGGLIGLLLGILLTVVLGKLLFGLVIWPNVTMSVFSTVISIVIGIIFGSYPAVKASGLQPVDALRTE